MARVAIAGEAVAEHLGVEVVAVLRQPRGDVVDLRHDLAPLDPQAEHLLALHESGLVRLERRRRHLGRRFGQLLLDEACEGLREPEQGQRVAAAVDRLRPADIDAVVPEQFVEREDGLVRLVARGDAQGQSLRVARGDRGDATEDHGHLLVARAGDEHDSVLGVREEEGDDGVLRLHGGAP